MQLGGKANCSNDPVSIKVGQLYIKSSEDEEHHGEAK